MGSRTRVFDIKHFDQERKPTSSLSMDMEDSAVGDDGFSKPTAFYLTAKSHDGSTVTMKLTYGEISEIKFRLEEALLAAAHNERMVKAKAYDDYRKAQAEKEAAGAQEQVAARQPVQQVVARQPVQPHPSAQPIRRRPGPQDMENAYSQ